MKSSPNQLAKYSGLAFQLLAYIVVGYFIGEFIDNKMNMEKPYGVAFTCSLFLLIGLITVVRDILKGDK